jgi:hypothetical protein
MSKALTAPNREDKGDVDPSFQRSLSLSKQAPNSVFPSYFDKFCISKRIQMLPVRMTRTSRRPDQKRGIAPAAAIMAIV